MGDLITNGSDYDESSIKALYGAERIRKRPASMLGSNNIKGAQHGVIEMYGNASDEITAGYGDKLVIKRHKDGSISIRDFGRGVPLGWNDDRGTYNWHLIYNELYAGGKYDSNQEGLHSINAANGWNEFNSKAFNYLYSVGLNGLGAASTQYTSRFFDVVSIREGEGGKNYKYSMHFEDGCPVIDDRPINVQEEGYDLSTFKLETEETDEHTGTYVHWLPDSRVFTDVDITHEWLYDLCKDIAFVAHIDLDYEDEESGFKETVKSGDIEDVLVYRYGDKLKRDEDDNPIFLTASDLGHGTITVEDIQDFIWVSECKIVLGFVNDDSDCPNICYHNTVKMESGVQYDAIKDAISEFMRDKAKARGVRLDSRDMEGVFTVVLSSYSNYASFRNQTKDAVDDVFLYDLYHKILLNKLNLEYSKENTHLMKAVENILNNAEVRIQLKEAEKQIRSIERMTKRQKDPEKFITCREYRDKNYERTELWITEGDSAKDSVVQARDSLFQAVYPIRGKGLNVFKASIAKILNNKEIRDIITIIGTGIDINVKGQKLFNMDDLRFDKIIFATDADVDGYQIRVLLFVLFYKLCPKLLTSGKIYIAETPRYAVKMRNGSVEYALNEVERDALLEKYGGQVSNISRFKGLGEVDAKVLRDTTVGVEGRNLIQLNCDFENELECDLIDALFGADKHKQRKEILTTVLGEAVAKEMMDNAVLLQEIDSEDIDEDTEIEEWA